MTPAEYIQLKAFARQDGALLSLLWMCSFGCYILGLSRPFFSIIAIVLALGTPVFAALRLRRFRDEDREGGISLLRGWAFIMMMFFYAGLLLAIVQYIYLAFIDQGYLYSGLQQMISSPEAQQMLKQYGMAEEVADSLQQMQQMRPIDQALNMLTTDIMAGIVLGLPIAALMQRRLPPKLGG